MRETPNDSREIRYTQKSSQSKKKEESNRLLEGVMNYLLWIIITTCVLLATSLITFVTHYAFVECPNVCGEHGLEYNFHTEERFIGEKDMCKCKHENGTSTPTKYANWRVL